MSRASVESLRFYLEHLKQKYIEPLERELAIVESVAKGAQQAVSYLDYASMVSSVSVLAKDHYKIGQNVMIVTLNVPDLWVSGILEEFTPFVYVSDEQFVFELNTNGYVDVGYHRLSALETGKINLPDYVKKEDRDEFVKGGVVENSLPLTDEDKTAGCNWLGAVKQYEPKDKNTIFIYVAHKDANGNVIQRMYRASASVMADVIPITGTGGTLRIGEPTSGDHAVNRDYFDKNRIYCHRITWFEPNFFDGNDAAMYFNIFARGASAEIRDESYVAEIKAVFVAGGHTSFDTAVIATTDNSSFPNVKIYYDESANEIAVCRMDGQDINQLGINLLDTIYDSVV